MQQPDFLIADATVATMEPGGAPYGLVAGAAVAVRGGRIAAVGTRPSCAAPSATCLSAISAGGW